MISLDNIDDEQQRKQLIDEYDELIDVQCEVSSLAESELDREYRYKEHSPQGMENMYPDKWFSKEQIEAFIRENYHAPQNDEEKKIQKQLEKIEQLRPKLKEYYSFPQEWEENGLADLVRELCCV